MEDRQSTLSGTSLAYVLTKESTAAVRSAFLDCFPSHSVNLAKYRYLLPSHIL